MGVQEGDTAPDFEMPASGGRTVSLAALKGALGAGVVISAIRTAPN